MEGNSALCLLSKYFYLNCRDNWNSAYKAAISPSNMVTLLCNPPSYGFQPCIREKQMFPDSYYASQLHCVRLEYNYSGCFGPLEIIIIATVLTLGKGSVKFLGFICWLDYLN